MRPVPLLSFGLTVGLALAVGGSIGCLGHQKRDPKGMAKNATIKNPKNAKRPSNATLDPNATAKEVQRKAQNKRVFGEVRAILKAKHSPLPELERKPTDSKENPGAQIVNDTPYGLTVWFAGPCSDKVEVQAKGNAEIRFCPGTYHIAAKVESPVFLPLVRESQDFELGIDYVLKIIIRAEPKTIIKRYKR